jgi:hypothetical protein
MFIASDGEMYGIPSGIRKNDARGVSLISAPWYSLKVDSSVPSCRGRALVALFMQKLRSVVALTPGIN